MILFIPIGSATSWNRMVSRLRIDFYASVHRGDFQRTKLYGTGKRLSPSSNRACTDRILLPQFIALGIDKPNFGIFKAICKFHSVKTVETKRFCESFPKAGNSLIQIHTESTILRTIKTSYKELLLDPLEQTPIPETVIIRSRNPN